ncbi:Alpha/beta hydrolase family protein [Caulifigura coniformis]|uniref:Alpha/beta hydrolase family protein n=1 Tax=Caulifigura coniformis TaxID=2527983 RepID=A0A517SG71_9PLAN|nr:alpha/beta fold hydrolase [Caulifigura coniformis]QDT55135.1 Alpha/beta hydrolase family protein [Caulifigura coniformis]
MEEHRFQTRDRRRTLRRLAGCTLAVLLLGWAGSTLAVTWSLTHRAVPRRPETSFDIPGVTRSDLTLTTSDGEALGAWLFSGRADLPSAIVMHGNNGSRSRSRKIIELLSQKGWTVLAVTLRAHGDSTGELNDIGWSARRDVITAVAFLEQTFPGRSIVVCGRSMSSAAAIFAAEELGDRVAGYWLEQPYNTLEAAAWRRLQQQLPPVFDLAAFTGMQLWSRAILPVSLSKIAPAQCICHVPAGGPLVILSGDMDDNLPLDDVQELVDQVRERARFVVFRGAGHVGMPETDPSLYESELDAFLKAVIERNGEAARESRQNPPEVM